MPPSPALRGEDLAHADLVVQGPHELIDPGSPGSVWSVKLVASTNRSRRPLGNSPTMVSDVPLVYTSAVSMTLPPASANRFTIAAQRHDPCLMAIFFVSGNGRTLSVASGYSAPHADSVVVSDSETHELGQVGHGAVEELEVTEGELSGSDPVRADV
jgi:hypothetical protein